MTTGQRIQKWRKKARLTQKQLGEKLGISASMIGQWENDLREPKYKTLERLADALGVSVYDFYYSVTDLSIYKTIFGSREPDDPIYASFFPQREKDKTLSYEKQQRLLTAMDKLSPVGQEEAIKRVEELTEIPRYQKEVSPPQEAPTDSETTTEGSISGNKET